MANILFFVKLGTLSFHFLSIKNISFLPMAFFLGIRCEIVAVWT